MNDKEIEKKQDELWKKGIGLAVFKKICLDEKGNCLCPDCQSKLKHSTFNKAQ